MDIRAVETIPYYQNEMHGGFPPADVQGRPGSIFRIGWQMLWLGEHQKEGGRRWQ